MKFANRGRSAPHCRMRILARSAVAASAFLLLGHLCAQMAKPTEYQVKATYLYHFTQFVQWPQNTAPNSSETFPICVLGKDPLQADLEAVLAGASVYGKSVMVTRISVVEEGSDCRILFISSSEANQLERILASVGRTSVLTVSDMPSFTQRGGMIQFTSEGNRIRFAVNLTSAAEAGLTLSSELLKLAVSVRRAPRPGD
jgi:YfiR/HmsC-like